MSLSPSPLYSHLFSVVPHRSLRGEIPTSSPLIATNLLRRPRSSRHTTRTKQRSRRSIIFTKIEVHVATLKPVLSHYEFNRRVALTERILCRQTTLATQRISIRRTKIINLNHNTCARRTQRRVTRIRIRQCCKLVAQATSGACAGARPNAEEVLRGGGVVAGVAVPTTSCGSGVTVWGAVLIAGAVSGKLVGGQYLFC